MACFILKKKKVICAIGIMSIVILCLTAPYKLGANGNSYSVLGCIINKRMAGTGSVISAFGTGTSSLWFYIIAPLIVSIPVLSYLSEVWKSAYSKMELMRTGRIKYNLKRIAWMFGGCACMLFAGITLFVVILLPFFSLADTYYFQDEVGSTGILESVYELILIIIKKYMYMLGYSYTVSVLAAIILFFYNDLYVVISIVFSLLYVIREWIYEENSFMVIIPAIVLSFIFILLGKWSERS